MLTLSMDPGASSGVEQDSQPLLATMMGSLAGAFDCKYARTYNSW